MALKKMRFIPCRGVDPTHPYFEGRVEENVDFVDNPPVLGDPNGHGTHVCGKYSGLPLIRPPL